MSFRTFIYSVKQGVKNISRNRMYSLASIGTITASLFLFGILFFVMVNFQSVLKTAETSVGITVFFNKDISQTRIVEIGNEIKKREEVKQVDFLSAEASWQQYKEEYLSEELVESFGDDNPLEDSDSYTIYLYDTQDQELIVEFLEETDGIRKVNYSADIVDSFSKINSIIATISVSVIIILIAVSIFLINSSVTMGVTARKEEISIMKLLGATNSFISAPFITEGLIIGVIGSLIPLVILYFIYNRLLIYISEKFMNVFKTIQFVYISDVFSFLGPLLLLIGIGIGFLGSVNTVRRQIKKVEVS
ncbi:MAG TPA: ABC transporter permease [Clostridiales bacterium]|nr:ABC transporter permease [Clostridiales bacterium]